MSTAPLETFIKKFQTAKNYNSKELRLTLAEAEELSMAIALLLSSTSSMKDRIIDLQNQAMESQLDLKIAGGSF